MTFHNGYRSLLIAVAFTAVAHAGTVNWTNLAGGNFSAGSNWDAILPPGLLDIASFSNASPSGYTVTFGSNPTTSQLVLGTDNVTFDLQGHSYTQSDVLYLAPFYSVEIGNAGTATLNLRNSTNSASSLNSVFASIGVLNGDAGTVNVTGPKVAWNASQGIYVGDAGTGTLDITGGATVSDSVGAIGNTSTGVGTAIVDASHWNNNNYFYVGNLGFGMLTVQNGGQVSSDVSYIGHDGIGSATITGANSRWTSGVLNVGYTANGTLNILNGANVSNSGSAISCSPDTVGAVTISGANSSWNISGTLTAGSSGAATITIKNNGLLSVGKNFAVANKSGTQINLGGGTLRVGSLQTSGNPGLILGNGVTTGWTSGTLDITNSDLSVDASGPLGSALTLGTNKTLRVSGSGRSLDISPGSSLNVAGGSVYANTLDNAGKLSLPAKSSVEVVNPLINTGLIDVGGGQLQLDAGVAAGDSVRSEILSAYEQGHWDGTTGIGSSLAAADSRSATGLAYLTNGATTTVKYTWYGDANGDGVVNGADLQAISSAGTTWQTGDFNYDGVVNADDWALFELGAVDGGTTNISSQVPEPASVGVLAIGALFACRRRRRK